MIGPDEALAPLAIRAGRYAITVESVTLEDAIWYVTLRFIVFDDDDRVRDIKEQAVWAPEPLFADLERVRAFAHGQAAALRTVFESPAPDVEHAMPHELIELRVLELVKPRTPDEFETALLTKKRLGRFLA